MLLEPGEYKIVNTIKPTTKKEETLNVDKVKFICKDCESTIMLKIMILLQRWKKLVNLVEINKQSL